MSSEHVDYSGRHMIEAELAEAEAWSDLVAAAPAPLARALGLAAGRDERGYWSRCDGLPLGLFNRRFAVPEALDAAALADHERGWLQLADHRARTIAELRARGFVDAPVAAWTKVRWPDGVAVEGPMDERVTGVKPDEAMAWARVVGRAHEMPDAAAPWTAALVGRDRWHALAWRDGDTIVAGAVLFTAGPRAWLGLGGTLPEHRRRGAQTALLRARVRLAQEHGAATIATETGTPPPGTHNPSLANMFRCGFVSVGQRVNLVRRDEG